MKAKSWMGLTAAGLVAMFLMTGCTEETTPGGPGAATTTEQGEPAQPEETFTLGMPVGATNIEQGASEKITIGLERGAQFEEEVQVSFQAPQGVTVDPQQTTIAPGSKEVEVTVTVDATTPPGELMIDVTGQAASGPPSPGTINIEVTEAEGAAGDAPGVIDTPPANTPPEPGLNPPPEDPLNPEGGAPPTPQDPNAAPPAANPEEGAPAISEENVESGEIEKPE